VLTQEGTLTATRTVGAKPGEVFRAFTNTGALRDWLCNAAQVDLRKGGRIYLWWNEGYYASGVFTEVKRGESLSFTWQGVGEPASEVHVALREVDGGTDMEVKHDGIATSEMAERLNTLWRDGLENLQTFLETGNDLRFIRRPMFGLNGADEMTPELAEKLGCPESEGLRLTGLVDGMGAQAAGLQKDDIVVGLGGREVANFASFVAAIQPHKAGDQVPVKFYRDGELKTVDMTLSSRPAPEIPTTVEGMVEVARGLFATVDKELDELLEGVTEEDAGRRPAPDEWSAKMVLAHLIASERDTQVWIAAMTEDFDIEQPYHSNSPERVGAIAKVYSPLSALVEELKREEALTVELAASMSEETAGHKHWFNQVATWLSSFDTHHREHFAEIKRLVKGEEG